jgi:ABC-type transporter Mla subunit MlaD
MSDTRSSEEIRADIEHTREELADTAAELAQRTDVKARAHEKVDETKAKVSHKVDEAKAKVTGTAGAAKEKVSDATPASVAGGAQHAAGSAATTARQNPIPVSVLAGVALGVAIGWFVASRRR